MMVGYAALPRCRITSLQTRRLLGTWGLLAAGSQVSVPLWVQGIGQPGGWVPEPRKMQALAGHAGSCCWLDAKFQPKLGSD